MSIGYRASTALAACVFALSGTTIACSSAPAPHYYMVTRPETTLTAGDASDNAAHGEAAGDRGVRLGVAPFQVDSPYDGDLLVYRMGRDTPEVAYYAHHRWAAPLRDQLPLAAASAFADLPGLASIAPTGIGEAVDAELAGRLLYLEELDVPGEQIARVGLELALFDTEGQRVWSQTLSTEVRGQAEEVSDVVRSMRQAVDDVLRQARPGLSSAIATLAE